MRKIRGLLVENEKELAKPMREILDIEFRAWGWTVDWMLCGNAVKARKGVIESDGFEFALIDIRLSGKKSGPDGLSVVEELIKRNGRVYTVIVTSFVGEYADAVERAKAFGAHLIIRKQLNEPRGEWAFANLAAKIRQHVLAYDPANVENLKSDDTKIGLFSILESLGGPSGDVREGKRTVLSLAMSCLDATTMRNPVFELSYLAAGRSGAHVCRVDFSDDNEPTQPYVLKIGLDKRALEFELKANREAAKSLSEQMLVRVIGDVHTDPSGYSAIIAKLADRSLPLNTWLRTEASAEQARTLAHVLFIEELGRLSSSLPAQPVPVSEWMSASAIMRLRAQAARERMIEILGHSVGGNRPDALEICNEIKAFVDDGTLLVHNRVPLEGDIVRVLGFGDLHSSNILVQTGLSPRPVLIDASRYGTYHWSADPARLVVDVFLRVRGTGLPSMLWDDFDEAARVAAGLCKFCDGRELTDGEAVDQFLHEIVTNLSRSVRFQALQMSEETWHWQWHVGLAKEFLRQGCHQDLTLPRGALALVAAAGHLRQARDLVDRIKY